MKEFVCALAAGLLALFPGRAVPDGEALQERILFWNLENFFDYHDGGGGESDRAFSARGERHWTRRRFYAKCNAVAKAVLWVASRQGGLPDVIALAEVENRFVLRKLLEETPLRKCDYRILHFDSPDPRGIDVALLYREQVFAVESARPVRVQGIGPGGDTLRTRDILSAVLLRKASGRRMALLVNHHPSKYGGGESGWKRRVAADQLRRTRDSLLSAGVTDIVAMGDFNDTPENPLFRILTGSGGFVNLAAPLSAQGRGTIRYNGRWELIDMFFVLPQRAAVSRMEILSVPFLTVHDRVHVGDKPLRTYVGPRYAGGVSDHCPILLQTRLPSGHGSAVPSGSSGKGLL